MAHHVQGIHYSDEAFNVVKGGFPSYSRKQSHPAVIWVLNQLELWILWNAGFLPLNEREWNQECMCWHFSFPRSILFFQNILSPLREAAPLAGEHHSTPHPSSPTCLPHAHPSSPTYQPHAHRHHPVHPRPIVTNLSTPCSSSPSCPPQAHCHQPINPTPIVTNLSDMHHCPTRTVSKPSLTDRKISTATNPSPHPASKWLQTSAAKAFSWTPFKQELSES